MTNKELIKILKTLPLDKEVFIRRADFGPCRIMENPRETIVGLRPHGQSCWETHADIHDDKKDGFPLDYVIII